MPSVSTIDLDTGIIAEDGSVSTITATISAAHSKDVTIPLTITGTATVNVDYFTDFTNKGEVKTVAGGNGYGNSQNQLYNPYGVTVDSSGNVYVADHSNQRIVKWAPGATEGISIITGIYPYGIHVDGSGNIYLSDHNNHRVLKYTLSAGSYTQSIVAGGNGQGSGLNQLNYPYGIHVDGSETIYVVDPNNHRIMKWSKDASQGIVVAGGKGQGDALNQLSNPRDLAVDSSGNIYIADRSNHRIVKWAQNAIEGVVVAGGNYGSGLDQLRYPRGIDLNSDNVMFISDTDNHRIIKWIPESISGSVVAGGNGSGSALNQLNVPQDSFISSSGDLYIVDQNNQRVQKVALNPKIVIKAGSTTDVIKFTSITDSSYEFDEKIIVTPSTSTVNATSSITDLKTITITDGSEPPVVSFSISSTTINENSSTDVVLTASMPSLAGKPIEVPFTISGTASETTEFTVSATSINIPEGSNKGTISVSTNGLDDTDVELVETIIFTYGTPVNATITETDATLNLLSDDNPILNSIEYNKTSFAEHESVKITATISEAHAKDINIPVLLSGDATQESDYTLDFTNKGLVTVLAGGRSNGNNLNQLYDPRNISIDKFGNIYVADFSNRRIMKWAPEALEGELIYSGIYPWGIHVDENENIYVSDLHRHKVLKLTLSNGSYAETTIAGNGNGGSDLNQLHYPYGIHVDESDNVYIADSHNHRIVKWGPGASQGVVVAGGNNNGNELNQLYYPYEVAVDSSNNIYVGDYSNRRIMKWAPNASEGVNIIQNTYSYGIDVDSSGNIYASDNNNSVHKYTLRNENYVKTTIAGGNSNGSALNQLNNPHGVYLNSGNIYIVDGNNHRILKVQLYPSIFLKSGSVTGELTINGYEDRTDEGDETIIITPSTSNATNVITNISTPTTLTISDNTISLVQKADPFLGLSKSSVSWGDFDNDGDKDVAIMGVSNDLGAFNDVYRNNEGSFARMNQNFTNLYDGDLSWVDLNKDGYLDLVVSGYNETPQINIYISKNNAQFFEASENDYGLPELFASKMAWGDLDNDGDIDLAITGIDANNNSAT